MIKLSKITSDVNKNKQKTQPNQTTANKTQQTNKKKHPRTTALKRSPDSDLFKKTNKQKQN